MADGRARRFVLPLILISIGGGGIFATRIASDDAPESAAEATEPPDASLDSRLSPAITTVAAIDTQAADADATDPEPKPEPDVRRILVSLDRRTLWLVEGQDTLLTAPVAIGMGQDFTYHGRKYHFSTPAGERTVRGKSPDPLWIPPEWHYYEKAVKMGLDTVVRLQNDSRILLADSSWLVVQEDQVGRINHFGYFSPFTPGTEIIYDGVMYIPPSGTAQRRVPNALGPFKLDMGDGYLIHGTHVYNEESIGEAVSHGCVRMRNEDITRLYPMVPVGTKVTIF